MFKKQFIFFITILLTFLISACSVSPASDVTKKPEITETEKATTEFPQYETETVALKDLSEYTIVYPSDYTEYRQQDVKFLRDVIKKVTGAGLEIISDNEAKKGKEIIIASSKRENGLEEALEKLPHGLDYVVGVRNDNIVLGGNNFYADMRAIYNFINNTLGYDDIEKIQGKTKDQISGIGYNLYKKPPIMITGSNFSVSAYTEQYAIRDMAEAHFNMTLVEGNYVYDTDEKLLNLIKWCARYEIFVMFRGETRCELLYDCPIIWTTDAIDEPHPEMLETITERIDLYLENYGKYGWKPFVNFMPVVDHADILYRWRGFLDNIPMVSFDVYPGHSITRDVKFDVEVLACHERYSKLARELNKEYWVYIESYNVKNWNQNTSKMFRWQGYIALSFGAKNILYFQYGDVSTNYTSEGDWSYGSLINCDYSQNPGWYDAQRFNKELIDLAPIYEQYENRGAYVMNTSTDPNLNVDSQCSYVRNIITDFIADDGMRIKTPYLIGFFDKKDNSNAHAFTIVNIEDLNDNPYESDKEKPIKIKINGENVSFYRNGVQQKVERDAEGYYNINGANGFCWFVTVE